MSARIAPEPISNALPTVADYRSRSSGADQAQVVETGGGSTPAAADEPAVPRPADVLPPLPAPPDPPGTMFAAAVMAGALSPRPETPQEIFLRLGSAWSPPDSSLHLADRTI
jgi:hypothetical protein